MTKVQAVLLAGAVGALLFVVNSCETHDFVNTSRAEPMLGQCVNSRGFFNFNNGTVINRLDETTYEVLVSSETSAATYNVQRKEMKPCGSN